MPPSQTFVHYVGCVREAVQVLVQLRLPAHDKTYGARMWYWLLQYYIRDVGMGVASMLTIRPDASVILVASRLSTHYQVPGTWYVLGIPNTPGNYNRNIGREIGDRGFRRNS